MKKYFLIASMVSLLSLLPQVAKADSISLADGTVINGTITNILNNYVDIETSNGERRINRNLVREKANDLIEIGYFNRKKIVGFVYHLTNDNIEIKTATGNMEISRYKVRNITLSNQK